jgi:hypothetical protein
MAYRDRLRLNPAMKQLVYAVDAKSGKITDFGTIVKFTGTKDQEAIVSEILRIAEYHGSLNITFAGVPYVNKHFNEYLRADLRRNIPWYCWWSHLYSFTISDHSGVWSCPWQPLAWRNSGPWD